MECDGDGDGNGDGDGSGDGNGWQMSKTEAETEMKLECDGKDFGRDGSERRVGRVPEIASSLRRSGLPGRALGSTLYAYGFYGFYA